MDASLLLHQNGRLLKKTIEHMLFFEVQDRLHTVVGHGDCKIATVLNIISYSLSMGQQKFRLYDQAPPKWEEELETKKMLAK